MLVRQRPHIAMSMLIKRGLKNLYISLYLNDRDPAILDTLSYYEIDQSIKLINSNWKYKVTYDGWFSSYPEINFKGSENVYGYVVTHKNVLLWAEKFPFVCKRDEKIGAEFWTLGLSPRFQITNSK